MALNPPLLKPYDSAQLALDDIHEFAKGQGYGASTFWFKTDKQVLPTVWKLWLWCAKGRDYTKASRTRHAGSCMTGCPFELIYLYNCLWSTQISLRGAPQVIAQSNQSIQEQMGNATGGESGGGSQDTRWRTQDADYQIDLNLLCDHMFKNRWRKIRLIYNPLPSCRLHEVSSSLRRCSPTQLTPPSGKLAGAYSALVAMTSSPPRTPYANF